ncbi:hypothetical protein ACFVWN_01270 [Nocardiopsis flavescens]|uniref:hypothetical protein n=1 Tax=Nocardiopsis flavescens TaxID=758803 RepID=UPI003662BB44
MNETTPPARAGDPIRDALLGLREEADRLTPGELADLLAIEEITGSSHLSCTDPVGRWIVGEMRTLGHRDVVAHEWGEASGDGWTLTVRNRLGETLGILLLVTGSTLWDLAMQVSFDRHPGLVSEAPIEVAFADHVLVNHTPHDVVLISPDGGFTVLGANPCSARVRTSTFTITPPGHPWQMLHERAMGTADLPVQRAARWLVVSRVVAVHHPNRNDLLVPTDLVSNGRGQVLWAGALARVGI